MNQQTNHKLQTGTYSILSAITNQHNSRTLMNHQTNYKHQLGIFSTLSKLLNKCITANTSAIWQHAAHTTNQLTSPSL